jgi:hypothetical protein
MIVRVLSTLTEDFDRSLYLIMYGLSLLYMVMFPSEPDCLGCLSFLALTV